MKRGLILLLVIGFMVSSCGSRKKVDGAILKHATVKKVVDRFEKQSPDFKTMNARIKGSFDDGYKKQSISVTLRMQKDEAIWISAKFIGLIPVAKLLITPNRVQFYEKINNQYFDGDYQLLSKWLGVEVDFYKVQNLLLGESLYPINNKTFYLQDLTSEYLLANSDNQILEKLFLIDKQNFRLKKQELGEAWAGRFLEVEYDSYKKYHNFLFPEKIQIKVMDRNDQSEIKIDYRSLEFNRPVSFPFEMPSGYQEIVL